MARRLRAPRIPTAAPRPPKHNMANRNTKESRTRERMLDQGKANYFRYEMEDLLKRSKVPAEQQASLSQTLWSKGSRQSLKDAKEYLVEKTKDGTVDPETSKFIGGVLDKYSLWR